MKYFFILLISVLLFASCNTQKRMARKCARAQIEYETLILKYHCIPARYDSSSNTESVTIIRDTTIYVSIPGETIHDSVSVPVPATITTPVSQLETRYAISRAWIENSLLRHTLIQKQSDIPKTITGALHTSTSSILKTIKVPYFVDRPTSKPLTWWQKLFLWSGIVAWWAVGLYIAIRFYKFKIG